MLFQTTHTVCICGQCQSETVYYSVGGRKGHVIVTENATGKSYSGQDQGKAVAKMLQCRKHTAERILGVHGFTSQSDDIVGYRPNWDRY